MSRGNHGNNNKSFSYTKQDRSFSIERESDTQVMSRDADMFTRKQEVERKKLFSLTQQYQSLKQEMEDRQSRITEYRRTLQVNNTKKAQANVMSLQKQIEHFKKKYDIEINKVNSLMVEIDFLRKQRKNFYSQYEETRKDLERCLEDQEQVVDLIEKRKSRASKQSYLKIFLVQTQNQMYDLKTRNEEEKDNYQKQFEILQKQIQEEKKQKDILNMTLTKQKSMDKLSQSFDTSSLLKRRLQKIISKNKDKVKILDQYMRNMTIIDEAFNQIKETTGITDIQEIQNTFIKAEEQNYSLLTYVDLLHQQIDNLEDQNNEVQEKLKEQAKENEERKKVLQATPDEEKFKQKVEQILEVKAKQVQQFQGLLNEIQPDMEQLLMRLADSKFNVRNPHKIHQYRSGVMLNEGTIMNFLADMDDFINELLVHTAKKKNMNQVMISNLMTDELPAKEFKSKIISNIQINNNQIQDDVQDKEKLLDKNRFIEIANETLEKKRLGLIKENVGKEKKKKEQI